jgi:hypothetical protein
MTNPKIPLQNYFLPPTFLTFLTVVFLGLALVINVCNSMLKSLLTSLLEERVLPNLTPAESLVFSLPVTVCLLRLRLVVSRELLLSIFCEPLVAFDPDLPDLKISGLFLTI